MYVPSVWGGVHKTAESSSFVARLIRLSVFCILHIIGDAGGGITLLAIRRGPLPGPRTGECELAYNDAGKEEEVPTGHAKLDTLRPERVRDIPPPGFTDMPTTD
jgi:hypothetical protein